MYKFNSTVYTISHLGVAVGVTVPLLSIIFVLSCLYWREKRLQRFSDGGQLRSSANHCQSDKDKTKNQEINQTNGNYSVNPGGPMYEDPDNIPLPCHRAPTPLETQPVSRSVSSISEQDSLQIDSNNFTLAVNRDRLRETQRSPLNRRLSRYSPKTVQTTSNPLQFWTIADGDGETNFYDNNTTNDTPSRSDQAQKRRQSDGYRGFGAQGLELEKSSINLNSDATTDESNTYYSEPPVERNLKPKFGSSFV